MRILVENILKRGFKIDDECYGFESYACKKNELKDRYKVCRSKIRDLVKLGLLGQDKWVEFENRKIWHAYLFKSYDLVYVSEAGKGAIGYFYFDKFYQSQNVFGVIDRPHEPGFLIWRLKGEKVKSHFRKQMLCQTSFKSVSVDMVVPDLDIEITGRKNWNALLKELKESKELYNLVKEAFNY